MEDPGVNASRTSQSFAHQRPVTYICGWCGKDNELVGTDSIMCMSCGHRIFYKKRIAEGMEYDAR